MNDMVKIGGGILVFAILVSFWLHYEISAWGECLEGHSWYYCMRILG